MAFSLSQNITAPLTKLIIKQETTLQNLDHEAYQETKKKELAKKKEEEQKAKASLIEKARKEFNPGTEDDDNRGNEKRKKKKPPDPPLVKALEMASAKGASNWLTSLPLENYHFTLNRAEFWDAICLRYGWTPRNFPTTCACGKPNSVNHALDCPKGGYLYMRHDALKELFAKLLQEAGYKDVKIEPHLLPLPDDMKRKTTKGETLSTDSDDARLDITAMSFWRPLQRAFFDVRVTNPLAPSNVSKSVSQHLKQQESEKKKAYNWRVLEVERASFTPLVFTVAGGCGREADAMLKRLATKLATHEGESKSAVMNVIRTSLSYTLIRSNTVCLRGSRESKKRWHTETERIECEIAQAEACLSD